METLRKIRTENLVCGMKFSAPLFFEDEKHMFLAENKPVRKMHLDAVSRWKIPFVLTSGRLLEKNEPPLQSEIPEEIEEIETIDDEDFS